MHTTLSGSHNGRQLALEVSGETWDRFRDWRNRLDSTNGAFLAEVADSRSDPAAALKESDVTWYLDSLDSFASGFERGEGAPCSAQYCLRKWPDTQTAAPTGAAVF